MAPSFVLVGRALAWPSPTLAHPSAYASPETPFLACPLALPRFSALFFPTPLPLSTVSPHPTLGYTKAPWRPGLAAGSVVADGERTENSPAGLWGFG